MKDAKREYGIGLVETIAALGIALLAITALVSLSVFTLRTSTRGKLLLQGTKLANNQVELVRAYRDSVGWDEFMAGNPEKGVPALSSCTMATRCHADIVNGTDLLIVQGTKILNPAQPLQQIRVAFYATDPINNNGIQLTDTVARINVEISWQVGQETKFTNIYTDVSNWRSQ